MYVKRDTRYPVINTRIIRWTDIIIDDLTNRQNHPYEYSHVNVFVKVESVFFKHSDFGHTPAIEYK